MITKTKSEHFIQQIRAHNPDLMKVFDVAFDCNGFVAGGCPRYLLTKTQGLNETFADNHDIDLFFESEQDYKRFLTNIVNVAEVRDLQESWGKRSMNFCLYTRKHEWQRWMFQAVGCHFGTPEQILATFDLKNVQVAFNLHSAWYDIEVHGLEAANLLKINGWHSPLLLARVIKYTNKHGYAGLVDSQRQQFIDWIYDTCMTLPDQGTLPGFVNMNRQTFKRHLANLLHKDSIVTNSDLLLFCGLFGEEISQGTNYYDAFSVFLRRMDDEKKRAELERSQASAKQRVAQYVDDSWY